MVQRRGLAEPQLAEQIATANHRVRFEQPMHNWGYSDTGSVLENVARLTRSERLDALSPDASAMVRISQDLAGAIP